VAFDWPASRPAERKTRRAKLSSLGPFLTFHEKKAQNQRVRQYFKNLTRPLNHRACKSQLIICAGMIKGQKIKQNHKILDKQGLCQKAISLVRLEL
jgi:hypothetical protein